MQQIARLLRTFALASGLCVIVLAFARPVNAPAAVHPAMSPRDPPGLAWRRVASPTPLDIGAVAVGSRSVAWAVVSSNRDNLLRWNGLAWTVEANPLPGCALWDVDLASADLGWLVGTSGYGTPCIARWNGSTWYEVYSGMVPPSSLQYVSVASPSVALAAGGAIADFTPPAVTHWNGSEWIRRGLPIGDEQVIYAASISSDSEAWITGWDFSASSPFYLEWNGSHWSNRGGPSLGIIRVLASVSPTDGWAMSGGGIILHWDGGSWNIDGATVAGINAIDMFSATDGWAVGTGGAILHWDGTAWNPVSSPVTTTLLSVSALSPTDVWATGSLGTILHYSYVYEYDFLPDVARNAPSCGLPGAWEPGASLPQPDVRAAGVWFPPDGSFYVLGGRSADTAGHQHIAPYTYDPQRREWVTRTVQFADHRVDNLLAGVLNGPDRSRIYTVGGSTVGAITTTSTVRVYDPLYYNLTELTSDPWPGNDTGNVLPGGAAVYNNKLYVLGGYRIGAETLNQIWEFDPLRPAGTRWALMPATLPVGLMHIPAATIGDAIYTAGGAYWNGSQLVDTSYAFRYDPIAQTVTPAADVPRPVSETSALAVDGKLWLLGGSLAAPSNEVDVYDPATNSWSLGLPFTTPRRMAAAAIDPATKRIFIVGGYAPVEVTNMMEVFTPEVPCE